mgnify:FL=1
MPQIYAPATFIVVRLLSTQINHLRRSISSLAMLHAFGNDSAAAGVTSRPTSHDGRDPSHATKGFSPASSAFVSSDYMTQDWRAKLVKVTLHRRVVVAQGAATLSTALCFVGLSGKLIRLYESFIEAHATCDAVFGVADGYSRVSGELSRDITLIVSAYAFLVVRARSPLRVSNLRS